jgi:DNA polymerase III epsilon subunit-like protein
MTKEIIFTTETDGLVRHHVVNEKNIKLFPNMLEFSMRIAGASENLTLLIDNGITIPEHITKINGIDKKLMEAHGVVPEGAINLIDTMIQGGDCLVSHNLSFHIRVLKAFYFRNGRKFPEVTTKCLQEDGTGICKILFDPEDPDNSSYKKPTLNEMKAIFNIPNEASKMDSLVAIYDEIKDVLSEQRPIKPASF